MGVRVVACRILCARVRVVVCRWLCAGVHVVCRCVCEVCVWLCAGVCTLPCCGRSARGWHWCQLGCGVCPADVDDCAASPCCQQVCTNSPGGYECSCYAGYRLSADGCGCEGEWWAAGVAGEWAVLRMTRGGLWPPPSTLSLGVGLMPAVCRLVEAFLFPPLCGHFLSGLDLHPQLPLACPFSSRRPGGWLWRGCHPAGPHPMGRGGAGAPPQGPDPWRTGATPGFARRRGRVRLWPRWLRAPLRQPGRLLPVLL